MNMSISVAEVWVRLGIVQASLTLLSLLQTLSHDTSMTIVLFNS